MVVAALSSPAGAHSILGSWCGAGDEAIWLGAEEATLGEHAFCRWDPAVRDGLGYEGVLRCRTTVDWHEGVAEHPLPVRISLEGADRLAIDHRDGGPVETYRRCGP